MTALTLAFKRLVVFGSVLVCVISLITACADDSSENETAYWEKWFEDTYLGDCVGCPDVPLLDDEEVVPNDQDLPYENTDWMADVAANKKLSELMIPGTHDTGADKSTSQEKGGGRFYITQDYYISNQLLLGVRWFDIRLRLYGEGLSNHHWKYFLHKNFNHLLEAALDFLKDHPTETVVFMIQQEYSKEPDSHFGYHVYKKLVEKGIDNFYLKNKVPTMAEARGKIVIVRRFDNVKFSCTHDKPLTPEEATDFGMQFKWDENTTGASYEKDGIKVYAQDHYKMVTVKYDEKNGQVLDCLKKASSSVDKEKFFVNFVSGYGGGYTLYDMSLNMNGALGNDLTAYLSYKRGIILINFAGGTNERDRNGDRNASPNLIQRIIDRNK